MNTSKGISTISYNTKDFLLDTLNRWYRQHLISDYILIFHLPESDEKKSHWHVYVEPNTKIDTISLQEDLRELDKTNPKPLGCINWTLSKIDDFILYSQHFVPYLASKGETREVIYQKEDFIYLDEDTFEERYRHAFYQSDWAKQSQIRQKLKDGVSGCDLILSGVLPLQSSTSLLALANLERQKVERNGHINHENNEFTKDIDK